jgi:uncharacterized protein YdeI (YjbR/CyaY-like superfamily)
VGQEKSRAEAPLLGVVETTGELEAVQLASQREWEEWLEAQHGKASGVWLKIAKKGSGVQTVSHREALESALCFGWIDAQRRPLDERFFLQRFTPRRRKSSWSRVNRDKVLELARAGRVRPAGLAEIERARRDGRWDAAYEPQSAATVPSDLRRELDANPRARAFFDELDSRNRYAILYRLQVAKRPETRARRLEKFVSMLNAREKVYP